MIFFLLSTLWVFRAVDIVNETRKDNHNDSSTTNACWKQLICYPIVNIVIKHRTWRQTLMQHGKLPGTSVITRFPEPYVIPLRHFFNNNSNEYCQTCILLLTYKKIIIMKNNTINSRLSRYYIKMITTKCTMVYWNQVIPSYIEYC